MRPVSNTPCARSSAALRVLELAESSGLFMAHYEYRIPTLSLDAPERWRAGVLVEDKYSRFRHDLLIGSFHPGHRAKWTAHELCHALVGFSWRPDASPLFYALAARLAEVLPVALWYFLDEADLVRCPRHAGLGARYRRLCLDCEALAATGPRASLDEEAVAGGRRFIARELAAVRQSMVRGVPVATPHGSLDLMSDGLAYAQAHGERLSDPAMHALVRGFFPPGSGRHESLEALIAQIEAVTATLLDGAPPPPPLTGDPVAQDLGYRLLVVASQTEPGSPAQTELTALVEALAADGSDAVPAVITRYSALAADYHMPDAVDVFAVGYSLPHGHGFARGHVAEGLSTCVADALDLLGPDRDETVAAFIAEDVGRLERVPLGRRFAAFLEATQAGSPAAVMAAFEAAIAHPREVEQEELLGWSHPGPGGAVALSRGVTLTLAPAAALGEREDGPVAVRVEDGEIALCGLEPAHADLLARLEAAGAAGLPIDAVGVSAAELDSLGEAGLIVPTRWALAR